MKKHYNLIKCGQKENRKKMHSSMFHIVCVFSCFNLGKMGLLFFCSIETGVRMIRVNENPIQTDALGY